MDIISHTLTGVAVGTVFATISKGSWRNRGVIILVGGFGGALPDVDALSLWSKFDSTIGSFLGLSHSGKEIYFGKFWYSHHAALHSLLAPIVLIIISILINKLRNRMFAISSTIAQLKTRWYYILSFFFGFLFHLLEDMPTPASVWGGVNLFYPSSSYVGGFGKVWWWNNYDLTLIIFSVIVLNLIINILPKRLYVIKVRASASVFLLGFALFLFQLNTRTVDFSYSGHTPNYAEYEAESKRIQKEILGDKLFEIMTKVDDKIPLNF